jgi:outer membrane receptor protein involved in Fe transport
VLQYVDEALWGDSMLSVEGKNRFMLTRDVDLESTVSYGRYEIDPDTRYVFPVNNHQELFLDDFKYGLGTGVTLDEKVTIPVTEKSTIVAGLTGSYFDSIPKATIPGGADTDGNIVSQGGTFTYYTRPGDESSLITIPRATNLTYSNVALYLQGDYKPLESLKLIAGIRSDINSRFDERPLSPRIAVIHTNDEYHLTTKYVFSKAFVAPAPYFGFNVFDNGVQLNTSNPDLEPERATSNELQLSWAREQLLLSGSYFYNTQKNLILVGDLALPENTLSDAVYIDPAATTTRILTRSVNGGESTAQGVDVSARYDTAWSALWASYSYVDYESTLGNLRTGLPQISAHNVRTGITIRPCQAFSVTPSLVWRSTPSNVTSPGALDKELRDPYEINLHALYTASEAIDLFVYLRNLTDNHYALRGVITPTPQEGRGVYGGLRVKF